MIEDGPQPKNNGVLLISRTANEVPPIKHNRAQRVRGIGKRAIEQTNRALLYRLPGNVIAGGEHTSAFLGCGVTDNQMRIGGPGALHGHLGLGHHCDMWLTVHEVVKRGIFRGILVALSAWTAP